MKAVWRIFIPVLALALLFLLPGPGFAAEKSLADILKEKGVITEDEYQQVKQMEEAQKAQEAKKAEEARRAEDARKAEEVAKKAAVAKPAGLPLVGYDKGFFLQSPDGKFKLVSNGVLRTVLELYQNNTHQTDQFDLDRARLYFGASYGQYWQSRVSFEMTTVSDGKFLKAAWLNNSYLPYAQVKVGQYKVPFTREYQEEIQNIDTIKFPMIMDNGNIDPKYDIGVMLWSPSTLDGLLWYGVGIFNGNGANNFDTNDDMDVIGRVALTPFAPTNVSCMKGLSFGGSFQYGRQTPTQTQSAPKLPTNWSFFQDVKYRGDRTRYGLETAYTLGPFKLQGEWIYQKEEREKQVRVDRDTHVITSSLTNSKLIDAPDYNEWGWYVLATYFPWGNATKGLQLVAQYEFMDADDDKAADKYLEANPKGKNAYDVYDPSNKINTRFGNDLNMRGNSAEVLTLGLNYFISYNIRLAFNYYWMWLDNKYTIDRIHHYGTNSPPNTSYGDEYPTPNGHAMQAFYLLAQVKW